MKRWSVFGILLAGALTILFGLSLWFRVTSLGTAPEPAADEAFFGVQAERLIQGRRPESRTGSGKPVDWVYVLAEAPWHLVSEPSFPVQRIPAVLFNLAAVVFLYVLGRRWFDRTTALIAAGLLATLPLSVITARMGCEYAEVPLLTILVIHGALRGRYLLMLAAFTYCVFISPTTVFLLPVPLGLLLVRWWRAEPEGSIRRRHAPAIAGGALGAITLALGLARRGSTTVQWTYATYGFEPPDWPLFLERYARQLLGYCQGAPEESPGWLIALFWAITGTVLIQGTWNLARRRRWERLAIVLGWVVAAMGYHQVVGPGGFHPALTRYALFLLVPAVLAIACAASGLLNHEEGRWDRMTRRVQIAGMLALGAALLICLRVHFLATFEAQGRRHHESIWTFRTEAVEPMKRIKSLVSRSRRADDLRGDVPNWTSSHLVLAEDWWTYRPIQYYLMRDPEVRVIRMETVPPDRQAAMIREHLEAGAFAVGQMDQAFEKSVLAALPPGRLTRWIVQEGDHPPYSVIRLNRPGEPTVAEGPTDHLVR